MIRTINTILLTTSITLNMLFLSATALMYMDMNRRMVFDLDQVRNDYVENVQFNFRLGCLRGTDYPPEFRKETYEFNTNSPVMWCGRELEAQEEQILNDMKRIGRRKR